MTRFFLAAIILVWATAAQAGDLYRCEVLDGTNWHGNMSGEGVGLFEPSGSIILEELKRLFIPIYIDTATGLMRYGKNATANEIQLEFLREGGGGWDYVFASRAKTNHHYAAHLFRLRAWGGDLVQFPDGPPFLYSNNAATLTGLCQIAP